MADTISQKIGRQIKLDSKNFPAVSIQAQLEQQGVKIKETGVTFYLLGDFLDRGEWGVKSFRAAEELLNLGVARYVTGNHDFWAFLNLMGFHLPVYEGYNFYGHIESQELVKKHWDDQPISSNRISFWTEKLAEYNKVQEELQKGTLSIDGQEESIAEIRKRLKELYLEIKDQLQEEEKDLLKDLAGFYFDKTDVYTGFNGLGMMSLQWWQEKLDLSDKLLTQARAAGNLNVINTWENIQKYSAAARDIVNERLSAALRDGQWWWQVFNDINHQNYTSVEWWGKDWSSHSGWGTSVIEELNKSAGEKVWNQKNYIQNKDLQDLSLFYRKNFTLVLTDAYGNKYTHGWMPVDEKTGQISFTYKGVTYADNSVWEGLEEIQSDVRDLNRPLSDLYEALSLVNSWYADKTTKAKPDNIKNYIQEVGLEKIYTNLGIRTWFTSHNPLNTLITKGIDFLVRQGKFTHVSVDKGMSWEKFADLGGYVIVTNGGIKLRGYDSLAFNNIVDSPDTTKLEKDATKEYYIKTAWKNEPLPAKDFLSLMEEQLKGELERQEKNELTALSKPRLNFADLSAVEDALKGIVEVTPAGLKMIDEAALRDGLIDKLVYDATFNPDQGVVTEARKLIKDIAASLGIKSLSVYDLYLQKAKDSRPYTIPAINIRGMAYNSARAVFQSSVENNVVDPFILEIAKSEIGYTGQRPAEYTTSMLAAAIKEGYKRPVYLQGDHFQVASKDYVKNADEAVRSIKNLIHEAIEGGFYQIDLDMSTLVDWAKPTADEQQSLNYRMTAELTYYVRQLERELGLDKQGIVVNLGGEIGEIGMGLEKGKERNSSAEDLRAFMNGYNAELKRLSQIARYKLNPITKIAVQSGTKHGGVRDATGKVVEAKVGFNTLAELGKVAREEFGLAGVVQHGASTLDPNCFTVFAGKPVPEGFAIDESLLNEAGKTMLRDNPVAEVHLATAYQDTAFDHHKFPADLRKEIVDFILKKNPPKEGEDPNKVFVDNRKNAWGPFKLQVWNIPSNIQDAIRVSLRGQFDTVFKNLGMTTASSAIAKEKASSAVQTSKQIVRTWNNFNELEQDKPVYITIAPSEEKEKEINVVGVGYMRQTRFSPSMYRLNQNLTEDIYIIEIEPEEGSDKLTFNLISSGDGSQIYAHLGEKLIIVKSYERINAKEAIETLAFRVFEDEKKIEMNVSKEWFGYWKACKEQGLITDTKVKTLYGYTIELKPYAASSEILEQAANLEDGSQNPGGIDFRVIPMITQPMGNLSGLNFSLPKLSNVENINLDEELEQIQKMLKAGITPSGARLKEFVAACYQKGELSQYLDKIVVSLVDLCKLEEERVDASANELKEVMLILDSIG